MVAVKGEGAAILAAPLLRCKTSQVTQNQAPKQRYDPPAKDMMIPQHSAPRPGLGPEAVWSMERICALKEHRLGFESGPCLLNDSKVG